MKLMKIIDRPALDRLFDCLRARGFELLGPTVREKAIVYEAIGSTQDLPAGWTDEHDGGYYRLKRRGDEALFGYVVGPQSWKKFLFPPWERLFRARRSEAGLLQFQAEPVEAPKRAFIGIRSCELHAIAVQDKVFIRGAYIDPGYRARRENLFFLAVNCAEPGGTCFCVSMNTGPKAESGFDLSLTEVLDGERHYFAIEEGSDLGREILGEVPHRDAGDAERAAVRTVWTAARQRMGREMDNTGIKELLYRNLEHPRWQDVADRCLSCANCTLVCPTCFCSEVEDETDLSGQEAERVRRWDSCFNQSFSYLVSGSVRGSTRSRYRQWMTHKLASWYDQFGTSGCVGCGRCITWCPVGIDITEEVGAIRAGERSSGR